MMLLGPEFRRNIWIRFSWFSLAVMPILIGLALLGTWLSYEAANEIETMIMQRRGFYVLTPHWSAALVFPALIFFFLVAIILGTYEAAAAFTDEQKNKTWDLQKTSAIRPSHIVLGKLFGAPSYAWYFSFGLLAVFIYAYSNFAADVTTPNPNKVGPIQPKLLHPEMYEILIACAYLVLAAFFGHAVALLGSLHNISSRKHAVFGSFIAGLIAAGAIFQIAMQKMPTLFAKPWTRSVPGDPEMMKWFDYEISVDAFTLASIGYFLFWLIVALYRYTRTELQFRNYPFVWLGFLVTLCIYMMGVVDMDDIPAMKYLPCFFVTFIITYYTVFHNSDNISGYRRFWQALRVRDHVKFLDAFPRWIMAALVCAVMTGCLFWAMSKGLVGEKITPRDLAEFTKMRSYAYIFILSMWLFMIRDAIVMHMFLLGDRFKHGGFNIVVYYILVYGLIPLVFLGGDAKTLNLMVQGKSEASHAWAFFYPAFTTSYVKGLLPVLNEILLTAALFWYVSYRFKRRELATP
jgi:hypothetical protein